LSFRKIFFEIFGYLKMILICAKTTQVLSPILLCLSPWRLWREHLTRHLVVSGSCHLSLGVLSKEEKRNQKKGLKFLSGARAKGGLEFWKKNLGSASKWVKH
jgi:hypothetical protein